MYRWNLDGADIGQQMRAHRSFVEFGRVAARSLGDRLCKIEGIHQASPGKNAA
jgi:hypothetical protein